MRLPRPGRRSRLLALMYGTAVFVWLSLEDVSVWPAAVFGTLLAILISVLVVLDKLGGRWIPAGRVPLLGIAGGAVAGLGSSVGIAALMFFKNARHAHLFPDYPAPQMLAVLERAPLWAIAGGLTGLSLGLGWLALRRTDDE